MSKQGPQRDDIFTQLGKDAEKVGGLSAQELAELAKLASAISSLPDEQPSQEELERGRQRLMAALSHRPSLPWAYGLPVLRAAAVLAGAAVLGLLALGGAWAAGARLPQPVAVGPLAPLASERSEVARDNHGQDVSEIARSGGGPGHGEQVRQEALDNPGRSGPGANSGPGRPDDIARDRGSDNSGPGSASAGDDVELVGTVQQQGQGSLVVNGITVLLTATTQIEGTLTVGALVKVEGSHQSDGTIVAREIEVRVQPGGGVAPPTAPPTTPVAVEIELRGSVQATTSGGFVLAGRTIRVTGSTEVEGEVKVGARVKVEGSVQADGSVLAREVKVEGTGDDRRGPDGVPTPARGENDRRGRGRD
jgi:cytoskeletal protein CcmA (bactofilin family)